MLRLNEWLRMIAGVSTTSSQKVFEIYLALSMMRAMPRIIWFWRSTMLF
jgi:hypothetical protein